MIKNQSNFWKDNAAHSLIASKPFAFGNAGSVLCRILNFNKDFK